MRGRTMGPVLFACTSWCLLAADPVPSELRLPGVVVTLSEQVEVPAREAGVLLSLEVREGETVEAGQLVGQIDDRDARLLAARAEMELSQARQLAANDIKVRFARKSADVSRAELQRALDQVERLPKSVSKTELDRLHLVAERNLLEIEQAEVELQQLQMSVSLKEQDLEVARLKVERRKIVSPITGMVVQWKRRRGEWVEPGTPVVRIIRLNRLRAEGFAPATALPLSAMGREVTLKIELPGQPPLAFSGELTFVSPEVDPVNGQTRFWAEIDNPQLKLRPGQQGQLVIHPQRRLPPESPLDGPDRP
uniref:HlyD family efflux transporter periplasmic adaptor subunit n=1 Tax=Schlesneria paludicola TaxID=360056 RepID=A0A7C4QHS0_9PLAN